MLRASIFSATRRICPAAVSVAITSTFGAPNPPFAFVYRALSSRDPWWRRRKRLNPLPLDQSQIDLAVSQLPPRFSASDLADTLARLLDPRLCPHLLSWALDRHRRRISGDHSPFLVAVKRLGAARLYRDMDAVADLALALPSLPPAEPHLNTLLYFYAEARMLPKAIHVYTRMRASPDPDVRPTVATYNLLFTALLGRDDVSSFIHHVQMGTIRALFRQMVDGGIAPDRLALNAMIKGYSQSLHLNDALRVFHQMGPVYGCEPDEHTYSLLVHGLCSQGRTRNARELFVEMRDKGMAPSRKACNSLISAMAMAGSVQDAVDVMWEVSRVGRAPDLLTCRTLLEEICRQGRMADAMALLKKIEFEELVDGLMCRELLRGIEDEFGDLDGENEWKCKKLVRD